MTTNIPKVVSLGESLGVHKSGGQIGDVDSGKGVGFSSVASDIQEFRMQSCSCEDVSEEVGDGVGGYNGPSVPVVGNALVALHGVVVAIGSFDAEPGLKDVMGEVSEGCLGSVVGHESVSRV